jgi:uncharacterized membrane protein YfcA
MSTDYLAHPFSIVVVIFSAVIAVKMYREFKPLEANIRMLAFCITLAGILGFLGAAWIYFIPQQFLDHFELPNMFPETMAGEQARTVEPNDRPSS